jgi:hypothetical protein
MFMPLQSAVQAQSCIGCLPWEDDQEADIVDQTASASSPVAPPFSPFSASSPLSFTNSSVCFEPEANEPEESPAADPDEQEQTQE